MLEPFELLGETLLRAGVAPARVRRYAQELSEHFSDLVSEEIDRGLSVARAAAAARARLGPDEALAEAMLGEPSWRSWTGRAPWATLVAGPAVLLLVAWLVPLLTVVLVMAPRRGLHSLPLPPAWLPAVDEALLNLVQFGGPLLIGCGIALLGARQRSKVIWPLLGCLVVAFFGAGLRWDAHWPTALSRGLTLSIGFRWGQSLTVGAFSLAVAAALYGMANSRWPADA